MFGTNLRNAVLAIAISFLLPVCAFAKQSNTLNLLTYEESPLVMLGDNGAEGLIVEVIKLLMQRADVDYKIRFMPPKRIIVKAEHTANFCAFPISRSQEREARFQWVSPILISRHAFYSQEKHTHPLRMMKDAKSLRIGSALGDGVGEYLEGLGYNVDNTRRNELNAEKLALQRVDLWLADTISAPYLAKKRGITLNSPELVFFTTLRSMGCHKSVDPLLIAKLQNTLIEMYRDGTINKLYERLGFVFVQE